MTVRPQFGPSLPGLLRERFGLSQRAATRATVAFVAGLVLTGVVVLVLTGERKLVHDGDPAFNLLAASSVRQVDARPGELMRLDASRGRLDIELVARRFHLPDLGHGAPQGDMPVYADAYIRKLESALDGFDLREEGKAGRRDVTGYQVGYRYERGGRRVTGRDMLLLPDEPGARDGVFLRLSESKSGHRALTPKERAVIDESRAAMRSVAFGTARP